MCSNETMIRLSSIERSLLEMLEAETAKGLEAINAEEMGEVVDMLKDLAEAKYYCSVVLAMHEEQEPMGYNPNRYADGRYAPKYGYEAGREGQQGGMTYQGGMGRQGGMGGGMGYGGTARDRYHEARMGYQSHSTADNRRMMEQAADEHMQEFEASLREMWEDADQRQRNKMKAALVGMANGLK